MNKKDRKRLMRLHSFMSQIPFPKMGTGTASSTLSGYIGFANDIKAIQVAFMQVLFGMATENNKNPFRCWIVGEDYDDPDILLDAIQEWIEMRSLQGWEISNEHSFKSFWDNAKEKMRERNE